MDNTQDSGQQLGLLASVLQARNDVAPAAPRVPHDHHIGGRGSSHLREAVQELRHQHLTRRPPSR